MKLLLYIVSPLLELTCLSLQITSAPAANKIAPVDNKRRTHIVVAGNKQVIDDCGSIMIAFHL
jgi:hypothetical protein